MPKTRRSPYACVQAAQYDKAIYALSKPRDARVTVCQALFPSLVQDSRTETAENAILSWDP